MAPETPAVRAFNRSIIFLARNLPVVKRTSAAFMRHPFVCTVGVSIITLSYSHYRGTEHKVDRLGDKFDRLGDKSDHLEDKIDSLSEGIVATTDTVKKHSASVTGVPGIITRLALLEGRTPFYTCFRSFTHRGEPPVFAQPKKN